MLDVFWCVLVLPCAGPSWCGPGGCWFVFGLVLGRSGASGTPVAFVPLSFGAVAWSLGGVRRRGLDLSL